MVCSDLPALREIAGGLAILVPPGDPTALALTLVSVNGAASGRRGRPTRARVPVQLASLCAGDRPGVPESPRLTRGTGKISQDSSDGHCDHP